MTALARLWDDVRATSAVEFGIAAPAFILLVLGSLEFGRMLWTENALQYAVTQAARCAVVNTSTCGTAAQIQSYAASQVYGQSIASSAFTVTHPACGVQVAAAVAFRPAVPLPTPLSMTLRGQACRPT